MISLSMQGKESDRVVGQLLIIIKAKTRVPPGFACCIKVRSRERIRLKSKCKFGKHIETVGSHLN